MDEEYKEPPKFAGLVLPFGQKLTFNLLATATLKVSCPFQHVFIVPSASAISEVHPGSRVL
jgi:hypothetical protein